MTLASQIVLDRFDELMGVVAAWQTVAGTLPPATPAAIGTIVGEARLLDDRRYDEWLEGWADDGVLWIPLDVEQHPAKDQAFLLDDVRRIRERVQWRRQSTAWSQAPGAATVRAVTNIEALAADERLLMRSVVMLAEHAAEGTRTWATRQFHELVPTLDDGWRIRAKVICAPALRHAVPHPGVLL